MRLIDTDVLLQVPNVRKVTEYDETGEGITYLAVPVEAIEKAHTIEAEPVQHGKWKKEKLIGCEPYYLCSVCGKLHHQDYNFCNNCGAKMDLEE